MLLLKCMIQLIQEITRDSMKYSILPEWNKLIITQITQLFYEITNER